MILFSTSSLEIYCCYSDEFILPGFSIPNEFIGCICQWTRLYTASAETYAYARSIQVQSKRYEKRFLARCNSQTFMLHLFIYMFILGWSGLNLLQLIFVQKLSHIHFCYLSLRPTPHTTGKKREKKCILAVMCCQIVCHSTVSPLLCKFCFSINFNHTGQVLTSIWHVML